MTHTLLVVDDNEDNRDMLSRRLQRKGFNVLVAEDGPRALEIIAREQVDLVLLDVMMPGTSGLDVLKAIRQTRPADQLPVIMATARSESEDVVQALEAGANDYVTKPLDLPVVLARVEAQLRSRPRGEPAPSEEGPAHAEDVQPGMVLAGKYRLESKIGEGGFGTVFRATHQDLDRAVAVKVLAGSVAHDPEALARFRLEGISACRISHPNAVLVLDFGVTAQGLAYLVMELLEGHSLIEEMRTFRRFPPERCAEILVPVCGVLSEAHVAGIIHRDVKPTNIFLQRTPRGEVVKVLDFGIAKLVGDAARGGTLTVAGTLVGTPVYMAPERFRGESYDGRSDVYSLGVMLYQMVAGRPPFVPAGRGLVEVAEMHVRQPPPPLRSLVPNVPSVLEDIVMWALCKDPEERPSAGELAWGLAQAAGGSVTTGKAEAAPLPSAAPGEATPSVVLDATLIFEKKSDAP